MGLRTHLARLLRNQRHVASVRGGPGGVAVAASPTGNIDENELITAVMDTLHADGSTGTMIDVGVHFGSCTVPMLERGWRVIGFEPDRKKHAALKQVAEEHPSFTLYTCAVGEKPHAGLQFYTSQESTGIASLVPFRESHEKGSLVPVRTLAEIVREQSLDSVDYLKIDAEGYDLRVLEGFPFGTIRPEAILCEFEDAKTQNIGYSTHDLGRALIEHGYEVYMSEWHPIVRYGITHRWRTLSRYPEQLADPEGWGNFMAFKPGPTANAAERILAPWLAREPGSPS